MLRKKEEKILAALKQRLTAIAGDRLQRVFVFGSYIWGRADSESDLDVAAIVRDGDADLEAALLEAAYQINWDYDFNPLISLKVVNSRSFDNFLEKGYSFYQKVAREGMAL